MNHPLNEWTTTKSHVIALGLYNVIRGLVGLINRGYILGGGGVHISRIKKCFGTMRLTNFPYKKLLITQL